MGSAKRLPGSFGSLLLLISAPLAISVDGNEADDPSSLFRVQRNGLPSTEHVESGKGMTELQAMLWKYTARCALRADQELTAPGSGGTPGQKFPGSLGVAPEWYGGTCDQNCQQKVSACLIALTNRTGKHVALSLLSSAADMSKDLLPGENELGYPHQEGAFFGNIYTGDAYACRGAAVSKAAQVKRLCALEPASCSGLAPFVDAGPCEKACKMACTKLSDGTQRCAAVSCTDPRGRPWPFPITTYLRNQIEAGNADTIAGATATDDGLTDLDDGDSATFKAVDFGAVPGTVRSFAASIVAPRGGARIEIAVAGGKRLGKLTIKATGSRAQNATTVLDTRDISGPQDVTVRFVGGKKIGRLGTIEFR